MRTLESYRPSDGDVHVTIAGTNQYAIPAGTRHVSITTNSAGGIFVAAGSSTVSSATDPQFVSVLGQPPIILHVQGMTHISFTAAGAASVAIAILSGG